VLSAVLAAMLFGSLLVEELRDRSHVGPHFPAAARSPAAR